MSEEISGASWYVVHTYSGYENKVKANIEKTIENRHLEDWDLSDRPTIPGSENDRQKHPHHRSGPLLW